MLLLQNKQNLTLAPGGRTQWKAKLFRHVFSHPKTFAGSHTWDKKETFQQKRNKRFHSKILTPSQKQMTYMSCVLYYSWKQICKILLHKNKTQYTVSVTITGILEHVTNVSHSGTYYTIRCCKTHTDNHRKWNTDTIRSTVATGPLPWIPTLQLTYYY